jgi:serine/threonine protein kinase
MITKESKLVEEMNSFKIQKTLYMKPNGSLYIPNIVDYGSFCQCKKENCRKENPCINASITVNRDEEVKLGNGMGVYSIQEKIKGGELFDRLANGEYVANLNRQKVLVRNILNAIKFIHEQGYAHYDLKPENILMVRDTDDIKIIDFGFTKEHGQIVDRSFGTPEYISPEVKNRNFNQKADYWALGCLFVFIFCSNYLYQRDTNYNLFSQRIRKNPKQYLKKYTKGFGIELTENQIDFLSHFFKNPEELWSFDQLLAHPYLSNGKKGGKIRKTRKKNNKKRKNMKHTKRNVDKKQKKTKTKNKVLSKSRKNKKK